MTAKLLAQLVGRASTFQARSSLCGPLAVNFLLHPGRQLSISQLRVARGRGGMVQRCDGRNGHRTNGEWKLSGARHHYDLFPVFVHFRARGLRAVRQALGRHAPVGLPETNPVADDFEKGAP